MVITRSGDYSVSTAAIAWAVALGVLALALIIGGLLGRRSGIVTLFALIALIGTIGASIVPKADHTQAVGEGTWRPVTAAQASGGFALGIGHATLDLSDLAQTPLSAADPITVKATVGIGQLTIKVPEGVSVLVRTSAGAGSLPRPQAVTCHHEQPERPRRKPVRRAMTTTGTSAALASNARSRSARARRRWLSTPRLVSARSTSSR